MSLARDNMHCKNMLKFYFIILKEHVPECKRGQSYFRCQGTTQISRSSLFVNSLQILLYYYNDKKWLICFSWIIIHTPRFFVKFLWSDNLRDCSMRDLVRLGATSIENSDLPSFHLIINLFEHFFSNRCLSRATCPWPRSGPRAPSKRVSTR